MQKKDQIEIENPLWQLLAGEAKKEDMPMTNVGRLVIDVLHPSRQKTHP